jgi:hypothetical protein
MPATCYRVSSSDIVWRVLIDEGLIVPGGAKHGATELPSAEELARPAISVYKDMQDLFLLDPIHDVNEAGWPSYQPPAGN